MFPLFLVLASGLAACSQVNPMPREQVAANLAPILRIERRVDQVKYYSEVLVRLGGISEEGAQKLKNTHDVYYVYYLAAAVHLARGNMESYLAHVKLAERELDSMEAIVKENLSSLSHSESARKDRFSNSGF